MSIVDLNRTPEHAKGLKTGDACRLAVDEPELVYLADERLWTAGSYISATDGNVTTELWITILSNREIDPLPKDFTVQHLETRQVERSGQWIDEIMLYLAPRGQRGIRGDVLWDEHALDAVLEATGKAITQMHAVDDATDEDLILQLSYARTIDGTLREQGEELATLLEAEIKKRGIAASLDEYANTIRESALATMSEAVVERDVAKWQDARNIIVNLPEALQSSAERLPSVLDLDVALPPLDDPCADMFEFSNIGMFDEWYMAAIRANDRSSLDAISAKAANLSKALADFKKYPGLRSSQKSVLTKAVRQLTQWQTAMPELFDKVRDAETKVDEIKTLISESLPELEEKQSDVLAAIAGSIQMTERDALVEFWDGQREFFEKLLELAKTASEFSDWARKPGVPPELMPEMVTADVPVGAYFHSDDAAPIQIARIDRVGVDVLGQLLHIFITGEAIHGQTWADVEACVEKIEENKVFGVYDTADELVGAVVVERSSLSYQAKTGKRVSLTNVMTAERFCLLPHVQLDQFPDMIQQLLGLVRGPGVKEFYFPIRGIDRLLVEQAGLKSIATTAGRTLAKRRL